MKWIKNLFKKESKEVNKEEKQHICEDCGEPHEELSQEEMIELIKEELLAEAIAEQQENIANIKAQVAFQLTKEGEVHIFCNWAESDEQTSKDLAVLLKSLCTSSALELITQILTSHMRQNPSTEKFVLSVIKNLYKDGDGENSPVIDPVNVFGRQE